MRAGAHLGSSIKIADTLRVLFMHAAAELHLTPYSVVHLLKEHGNSREVSNVSISQHTQTKLNFIIHI